VLPLYAFNVTPAQYGRRLEFTICTDEIAGFDAYLSLYASCATGANDTFFSVPANASDADGFCASTGRVLDVSVGRALVRPNVPNTRPLRPLAAGSFDASADVDDRARQLILSADLVR
jgi:hypothetical protein